MDSNMSRIVYKCILFKMRHSGSDRTKRCPASFLVLHERMTDLKLVFECLIYSSLSKSKFLLAMQVIVRGTDIEI